MCSIKKYVLYPAKGLLLLLGVGCCLTVLSQKQDYIWLSGYSSASGLDSFTNKMFGCSKLNFNVSPVQISYDSLGMSFDATNVTYSTATGELLFYCNGIHIRNSLDEKIENSDSLNAGYLQYQVYTNMQTDGYRAVQGILALEDPAHSNKYFILHSYLDTIDNTNNIAATRIYYTYLDMEANAGHGKVLVKNQTVLSGYFGNELKAVRHANGRDWWILIQRRGSNCYEKVLLNDKGLHVLPSTCLGTPMGRLGGSSCFSQDGSKYVYISLQGNLSLFDFDRCSGNLTQVWNKSFTIFADSGLLGIGTAFSPNSRFLYLNAHIHSYQFDLWANDIWESIDTIARFDGSANPFGSVFSTMQIAPDGKIYSSCGNGEFVYHVIERPDEKGDSCLFMQHSIDLPSYAGYALPNFPNYRLGALSGSNCDTLTSTANTEPDKQLLEIYPNPAADFVVIDYGNADWSKGEITMQITNAAGQLVCQQQLPMYSGFQKVDVTTYASGVYHIYLKNTAGVIANRKFSKQ